MSIIRKHRLLTQIILTVVATTAVLAAVPKVQALITGTRLFEAPGSQELQHDGRRMIPISRNGGTADVLPRIELEKGKSLVLATDFDVERIAVADPNTATLVLSNPRTIQVVALQPGGTNILMWDDAGVLQAAIDVHVGLMQSQVEIKLREMLGTSDLHVEMAGASTIVLRGTAASLEDRERAERLAIAFMDHGGEANLGVVNLIDVAGNHQVQLEVVLAEINKTLGRRLQINYKAMVQSGGKAFTIGALTGGGGALADGLINGALSGSSPDLFAGYESAGGSTVDAFIKFAKANGLAKILAEPTLVARSGEKASFLAGGEVPIPIPGGTFGQVNIEFKKFGVGVDFVPTVLGPDRIHLDVTPEVSEPDPTIGVSVLGTTVPGFNTRRASTSVELGDGQSFAIAGLLQDKSRQLVDKVPGLGDLPVLGSLFRSQEYQRDETELMIIVTPRLVKPLDPNGPRPLPTDHMVEPDDVDFYLLGRMESRKRHDHGNAQVARAENAEPDTDEGGLMGDAGHRVSVPRETEE